MTNDHGTIKAYRRAVAAMKSRPKTDPLSWEFQANMHGARMEEGENPGWRWCMHSSWWFLPWHRGYLYYFERIVRKLSQDDAFALPYWPWEVAGQDILPAPFRSPAGQNSLYDGTRNKAVNDGDPISQDDRAMLSVGWAKAMGVHTFASPLPPVRIGFGGSRVAKVDPGRRPDGTKFYGEMERSAHNRIHTLVGGDGGNMGDPETAARDPIFWLHHANVDRLWNRWLDQPQRRLPDDSDWWEQAFPFYDENGNRVLHSVREILALAAEGYRYNDDVKPPKAVAAAPAPGAKEKKMPLTQTRVGAVVPEMFLGTAPFSKPLSLIPETKPKFMAALAAPSGDVTQPTVVLQVEGIRPPAKLNFDFNVYVVEAGAKPDKDHFVGPITFFGRGAGHGHRHADATNGYSEAFDATGVLKRIRQKNGGKLPELRVVIVPHSNDPSVSDAELAKRKMQVPFGGVSLTVVSEEMK